MILEDFIKRLEQLFEYYGLSASSFADKIQVQRSTISHLLAGRNKPSLDFILKIVEYFPEVDVLWILNGKGTFPKNTLLENTTDSIFTKQENIKEQIDLFSNENTNNKVTMKEKDKSIPNNIKEQDWPHSEDIEQIVCFYKDGTFKIFKNKK